MTGRSEEGEQNQELVVCRLLGWAFFGIVLAYASSQDGGVHYCTVRNKVVHSGMVRFDERVNDRGKLVLSWDPSVVVPLGSLYDCVRLDAPYFEKFTGSPTVVHDIAVYALPDFNEFTGVVKLASSSSKRVLSSGLR